MVNVYKGFWTNWDKGRVDGATLTVSSTEGLILGSFLTLYVQFAGMCFWRVICFILHQIRSTTNRRDGLFHQQQIILRNSITPPSALWGFVQLAIIWKGKVDKSTRRSMMLVLIALTYIATFTTAGLFASQVTDTVTGQALVQKGICGFPPEVPHLHNVEPSKMTEDELLALATQALLGRITFTKSSAYVRSCYSVESDSDTTTCNIYVQPQLIGVNSSALNSTECPFGNNACAAPAVRYDSGAIDSNKDLGINAPRQQSLSIRRVTTCAPIDGEKYASGWIENVTETYVNQSTTNVKFYDFGPFRGGNECFATNATNTRNGTAASSTFCTTKYERDNIRATYTVRSATAYHNNIDVSGFEPIADFQIANSDVTLVSILNNAEYYGNITDPLFKATNTTEKSGIFSTSTNDLNFLGCTEQYQLCSMRNQHCSELTGLYGIKQAIERNDLGLDTMQHAISRVIWEAAWAMSLQWAVEVMGDDFLLARDYLFTTDSASSANLQDHHWILEAHNIHNLSLAVLQHRINEYAQPESFQIRSTTNSLDQITEPQDPDMKALCSMQRIRSSTHSSVSVFGLCIILIGGAILVILDWVLVQQIFWFRSVTHTRQAKKADWKSTGNLELHRKVLEARGIGPWDTRYYDFPTLTTRNQTFEGFGAHVVEQTELDDRHGRRYTTIPSDTSALHEEIHVLGDRKNAHDK